LGGHQLLEDLTMSMSVTGASPVGYTPSPQPQSSNADQFSQLLNQLASNYGMSPQQLFDFITSAMNQPGGGGLSPSQTLPSSGAGGLGDVGGSGGADSGALKKALGQFAANTLQSGQGMMQEAMQNFFKEEEPDEDDPDAEPL
jgi:hypothetical protein